MPGMNTSTVTKHFYWYSWPHAHIAHCLSVLSTFVVAQHAGAWQQILHAVELGQVPYADFLALGCVCFEVIAIMQGAKTSSYG